MSKIFTPDSGHMKFYAVRRGRARGVYRSWVECKRHVEGFKGAEYRSFKSAGEANAYLEMRQHKTPRKSGLSVYTDGSRFNGDAKHRAAGVLAWGGYGVWFGDAHPWNRAGPLTDFGLAHAPTNQRAELAAVRVALNILDREGIECSHPVYIHTDSKYVIHSLTKWVDRWETNEWMTSLGQPVLNRDLIEPLNETLKRRNNVKFEWVKGHSGVAGNEGADRLAKHGAELDRRARLSSFACARLSGKQ
jgi:ribonuclease HI